MRTLIDTSVAIALCEHDPRILDLAEAVEGVALLSILSVVELEVGVMSTKAGAAVRRQLLDEMLKPSRFCHLVSPTPLLIAES